MDALKVFKRFEFLSYLLELMPIMRRHLTVWVKSILKVMLMSVQIKIKPVV